MFVERTDKEVIIRLSASIDTDDLQAFLDYARYSEITSKYKVEQKVADKLAEQINKGWWSKNSKKFNP